MLPIPYDGEAGKQSLGQIAQNVVAHYKWLYRWSNEIATDADLDLKKLAQLAFQHCQSFAALLAPFRPLSATSRGMAALASEFAWSDMEWPDRATMATDLNALADQCAALFAYVRDNVTAARNFATRTYDATGREVEAPVKIAKAQPIVQEVAKIRALFAETLRA